ESAETIGMLRCRATQTSYAIHYQSSMGRHSQLWPGGAKLFHFKQGPGVGERIAAHRHGQIITTMFPLLTNPSRDPPDRGVIKEQGFDHSLQQIDQVIVAANVRQFVSDDRLQLLRRQSG